MSQIQNENNIMKKLRKRYIVAFVIILVLVAVSQVILQDEIVKEKDQAGIVYHLGKEHMYPQQLTKAAYAYFYNHDMANSSEFIDDMKKVMKEWKISRENLILNTSEIQKNMLDTEQNIDKGQENLTPSEELDRNYKEMLAAAQDIIDMAESKETYSVAEIHKKIRILEMDEERYLIHLEQLVNGYNANIITNIDRLSILQIVLFMVLVLALSAQVLFVYLPGDRRLGKKYRELIESRENFRKMFEISHGSIFLIEKNSMKLIDCNEQAKRIFHLYKEDEKNRNISEILKGTKEDYQEVLTKLSAGENVEYKELELMTPSGSSFYVILSSDNLVYQDTEAILLELFPITDMKVANEVVKKSEEKYRLLAENSSDSIWVYNYNQSKFVYASPAIYDLLGYTVEEILELNIEDLVLPKYVKELQERMKASIEEFVRTKGREVAKYIEVEKRKKDGSIIWAEISAKYRFNKEGEIEIVGVSRDITNRKKAEQQILHLSYHDALTGIYNRHYFMEKIEVEISRANIYWEPMTLILLDLDHFKSVNDNWGHPEGDEVLKTTVRVIEKNLRKSDIFARIGGEEFIILLPNTKEVGGGITAEKIRRAIEMEMYKTVGHMTASFGVAEHFQKETYIEWYKRVDEALYLAKSTGRNKVVCYENKGNLHRGKTEEKSHQWTPKWEIDESFLDNQHKEIIRIGNELLNSLGKEEGSNNTNRRLEMLIASVFQHFQDEEEFLKEKDYEDILDHKKSHEKLITEILLKKKSFEEGQLSQEEFLKFLFDEVVINHIDKEDIKFSKK